jgi:hypothetical protein
MNRNKKKPANKSPVFFSNFFLFEANKNTFSVLTRCTLYLFSPKKGQKKDATSIVNAAKKNENIK